MTDSEQIFTALPSGDMVTSKFVGWRPRVHPLELPSGPGWSAATKAKQPLRKSCEVRRPSEGEAQ